MTTMPKTCSICSAEMRTLPVTTRGGTALVVSICRTCDRRACRSCGHSEQNVYAKKCSACGEVF